jgi:alpha-L-glutamate ligase-like protein
MLARLKALRKHGVLGLNRRNGDYISLHNPRRRYPLVDDKVLTKELAVAAGMAVPELYGIIATQHETRDLSRIISGRQQFVLKPAHGSGGNGIVVITGRRGELHRKSNGEWLEQAELEHHVSSALSGLYSLGGRPDRVIVEHCVECDPIFEGISYEGVPDIRVIVFHGYPVMAMLRLPTRASEGKANLHQGAVGVGIDLATGTTVGGVLGNSPVHEHPDTGHSITDLTIPDWGYILELAGRACEITGLGYVGVDVVLDRTLGPLILELNARPGLNIQIANRRGLQNRLELVREVEGREAPLGERLRFVRERFRHG